MSGFFKILIRHLGRHWLISAATIVGLSAGFAVFYTALSVFLSVAWSDSQWQRDDNIFLISGVAMRQNSDQNEINYHDTWSQSVPAPVGPVIQDNFDNVQSVLQLTKKHVRLRLNDKSISARIIFVEGPLDQFFSLHLIDRDLRSATSVPNGIILSSKTRRGLLGSEEAMNQTILVEASSMQQEYVIAAIAAPFQQISFLDFDAIVPVPPGMTPKLIYDDVTDWNRSGSTATLVQLDVSARNAAFKQDFIDRMPRLIPSEAGAWHFEVEPVKGLMLWSKAKYGIFRDPIDHGLLLTFCVLAILVFSATVTNHMGLRAMMAVRRVREMAVRRMVGAKRGRLALRLLGEEMLLLCIVLVIASDFIQLLNPWISGFLGFDTSQIGADNRRASGLVTIAAAVTVAVGSSLFPTLRLTAPTTASLLRDAQTSLAGSRTTLHAIIVATQVALSIGFCFGALVVFLQAQSLTRADHEFEIANKLHIHGQRAVSWSSRRAELAKELAALPWISRMSFSSSIPFISQSTTTTLLQPQTHSPIRLEVMEVDVEFFNLYGMRLLAGRMFDESTISDIPNFEKALSEPHSHMNILVNQEAARQIGLGSIDNAIGFTFETAHVDSKQQPHQVRMQIIGVVSDTHFKAGNLPLVPTYFMLAPGQLHYLTLELTDRAPRQYIERVKAVWKKYFPEEPFHYSLAAENYDTAYRQERRLGEFILACALIAATIGMVGIVTLTRHEVLLRQKEIALRRVLGARKRDIMILIWTKMCIPVIAGALVGLPIAYSYLKDWISSYQIQFGLSLLHIGAFALVCLVLNLALVSRETAKTLKTKPVELLNRS